MQMYNTTVTANDQAFVDVRVCELQIQYGNLPSGLDSGFQVDGLYIVLRCGEEVQRTSCLWSSAPSSTTTTTTTTAAHRFVGAHAEGDEEGDWVWNELFRFRVPPAPPAVPTDVAGPAGSLQSGPQKPLSAGIAGKGEVGASQSSGSASFTPPLLGSGGPQSSREGLSNAVLPMSTAAASAAVAASSPSTPPQSASSQPNFHHSVLQKSATPAASASPFLHPALDIELWRSTPSAENCLARYTYHVPLELMHGGYGLQQLDAVAERVVPLRTKEAPSIMGNLYGWSGHRLSLLLRVQAVGLPPVTADWTLPTDIAMSAGTATSNLYALPYSVALSDPAGRSALLSNNSANSNSASSYGAGGYFSSPYNTLNPVLANLLAPLGVNTASSVGVLGASPQGPLRPATAAGVMGFGGTPGGVMQPVLPSSNSGFYATASSSWLDGGRAGPVLPSSVGGNSGAVAASSGQGILGDGDSAWRGPVLPPVLPS